MKNRFFRFVIAYLVALSLVNPFPASAGKRFVPWKTVIAAPVTPSTIRSFQGTTYASRTNTTLTKPSGTVDGDLLVACHICVLNGTLPSVTGPAGWTLVSGFPTDVSDGSFKGQLRVYYKQASSEGASYTWTHTTASSDAVIYCVQNPHTYTPQIDWFGGNNTTSQFPSVESSTAGAAVMVIGHNWQQFGSATAPTGTNPTLTERQDSAGSLFYCADGIQTTAGATSVRSMANNNGAGDPWQGVVVVVSPAPGSPTRQPILANALMYFTGITNGTAVSTTNLASGTVGYLGTWATTIPSGGFTIEAQSQSLLTGVVVDGTTYAAGGTSNKRIALTSTKALTYADLTPAAAIHTKCATAFGWVTIAVTPNSNKLYDFLIFSGATTGRSVVMQVNTNTGIIATIETATGGTTGHPVTGITISNGTYWCVLSYNSVTAVPTLTMYNTSGTLVGSITHTQDANSEEVGRFRIGNGEAGNDAAGTHYFESIGLIYGRAITNIPPN